MRILPPNLATCVNYSHFRFPLESVEDERSPEGNWCFGSLNCQLLEFSLSIDYKGHLGVLQLMGSCLYLSGMKPGHPVYTINVGHITELHNKWSSWSHLGKPKLNLSNSSQSPLLGVQESEERECILGEEIKHFLGCLLNSIVLRAQDVASLSNG